MTSWEAEQLNAAVEDDEIDILFTHKHISFSLCLILMLILTTCCIATNIYLNKKRNESCLTLQNPGSKESLEMEEPNGSNVNCKGMIKKLQKCVNGSSGSQQMEGTRENPNAHNAEASQKMPGISDHKTREGAPGTLGRHEYRDSLGNPESFYSV